MTEPTFDHEQGDVDRQSIPDLAFSHQIAKSLGGSKRQARDQWLCTVRSISQNMAKGTGKQSLKNKSRLFDVVRGSALECVPMRDILRVCDAIDDDSNWCWKTDPIWRDSRFRRLIQISRRVSKERYECEYRPGPSGLSTSTIPPPKLDVPS
ncbi:MAG: four helix bundle protein [Planctomycetaceae bacterium]|nr:four helix bundle protein [Planctomycetaceae bacterium]